MNLYFMQPGFQGKLPVLGSLPEPAIQQFFIMMTVNGIEATLRNLLWLLGCGAGDDSSSTV